MDSKEVSFKDATLNLHQQTAYPSPSLISSLDTEGAQSMHITPTANKRTFHAAFPPSTLFFRRGQSYPRIGTKLSAKRSPIPPSRPALSTCASRLLTHEVGPSPGVYQRGIDFSIELWHGGIPSQHTVALLQSGKKGNL